MQDKNTTRISERLEKLGGGVNYLFVSTCVLKRNMDVIRKLGNKESSNQ